MGYRGFTSDIVESILGVPGVYGFWPSSWSHVPPALVLSPRASYKAIWEIVDRLYRDDRTPAVRPIPYPDDLIPYRELMAPAEQLVESARARGIAIDMTYPVSHYGRIYIELGRDETGRDSPEPARWLRQQASDVSPGSWPIEIREQPWHDSFMSLRTPPGRSRGPERVGPGAPAWVQEAAQRVYDAAAEAVGPGKEVRVTWDKGGDGGPEGRLYLGWSDGPLEPTVAEILHLRVDGRRLLLEHDSQEIAVVVSRGLTQAFQLAAIETRPEVMLADFVFKAVRDSIPEEDVDPRLIDAWRQQAKAHPLISSLEKEPMRAYLARHREEVRSRLLGGEEG